MLDRWSLDLDYHGAKEVAILAEQGLLVPPRIESPIVLIKNMQREVAV